MTTSGTYAFSPDITDIIEDAATMAGVDLRTGYDYRMARFALNSLFQEWGNRGLNLWTIIPATIVLAQGIATYSLPANTIDVMDVACRTGTAQLQQDVAMMRISFPTYTTLPNKTVPGRPVQYYVARLLAPTITLWPVPDQNIYTLYYFYMRRIEDTGNADKTPDIPVRAIPAITAGLAYHVAMRRPEAQDRVPFLKQNYEEQYNLMAGEDRERATLRLVPRRQTI